MSGFSTPCSSMFMLPMRSMVLSKSKPWNRLMMEMLPELRVAAASSGCRSRSYSPAATRKPQVPQAGSQMMSVGCGLQSSPPSAG